MGRGCFLVFAYFFLFHHAQSALAEVVGGNANSIPGATDSDSDSDTTTTTRVPVAVATPTGGVPSPVVTLPGGALPGPGPDITGGTIPAGGPVPVGGQPPVVQVATGGPVSPNLQSAPPGATVVQGTAPGTPAPYVANTAAPQTGTPGAGAGAGTNEARSFSFSVPTFGVAPVLDAPQVIATAGFSSVISRRPLSVGELSVSALTVAGENLRYPAATKSTTTDGAPKGSDDYVLTGLSDRVLETQHSIPARQRLLRAAAPERSNHGAVRSIAVSQQRPNGSRAIQDEPRAFTRAFRSIQETYGTKIESLRQERQGSYGEGHSGK